MDRSTLASANRRLWTRSVLAAVVAAAAASLIGPPSAAAVHDTPGATVAAPPLGFDRLLVFLAAGFYVPDDPGYVPRDPLAFQRDVMRRDDAAIAREKLEAQKFFAKRFGLDAGDPALRGHVRFEPFTEDTRRDLRAHVVSGERVPRTGWPVRSGGWLLTVTDPRGVTLGGESSGTVAPVGATMVYAEYVVQRTEERDGWRSRSTEPIVLRVQSWEPSVPDAEGARMLRVELIHPQWGVGLAQGLSADLHDPLRGGVTANVRLVATFPAPRR